MTLSAIEVVTRYTGELWNQGKLELVSELCADPITRHEAGKLVKVSNEDQMTRVSTIRSTMQPYFETTVQFSDGEYVALAFQFRSKPWPEASGEIPDSPWLDDDFKANPEARVGCGIEIFKVVEGRITDVWNAPLMEGEWA